LVLDLLGPLGPKPGDTSGVLGGQAADDTAGMDTSGAGGLRVGLNTCAATGVLSAYAEQNALEIVGCHGLLFIFPVWILPPLVAKHP